MEKFALLNLLKAIETLSPKQNSQKEPEEQQKPVPEEKQQKPEQHNYMADVLARHEAISNRIKRKK